MTTRKTQTKSFLIGAIAGVVAGSVTALLLAPKPGKELRKDIADGAQQVGETTVKVTEQVTEMTGRVAKQVSGQAVHLVGKTKVAAESVKSWYESRTKTGTPAGDVDVEAETEAQAEAAEQEQTIG